MKQTKFLDSKVLSSEDLILALIVECCRVSKKDYVSEHVLREILEFAAKNQRSQWSVFFLPYTEVTNKTVEDCLRRLVGSGRLIYWSMTNVFQVPAHTSIQSHKAILAECSYYTELQLGWLADKFLVLNKDDRR